MFYALKNTNISNNKSKYRKIKTRISCKILLRVNMWFTKFFKLFRFSILRNVNEFKLIIVMHIRIFKVELISTGYGTVV